MSKNYTVPLLNDKIYLGNGKLKFNSVKSSNCTENSIPNRLKVVQPQSSSSLMWWRLDFNLFEPIQTTLIFKLFILSPDNYEKKISNVSNKLERESGEPTRINDIWPAYCLILCSLLFIMMHFMLTFCLISIARISAHGKNK